MAQTKGIDGGRAVAFAIFVAQLCCLVVGESDDPMLTALEPVDDPAVVALLQIGLRLPLSAQAQVSASEHVLFHTATSGNATRAANPIIDSAKVAQDLLIWTLGEAMKQAGLPMRFEFGMYPMSGLHALCLVACYLSYSVVCLWYELRCAAPHDVALPGQEKTAKHRDGKMDFIRLVMHMVIITEHVSVALEIGGMGSPMEAIPGMEQNSPNMPYLSTRYKMCIFAILSGIFGASVDFDHLTNVLCYTIGAIFFVDVIIGPILACLTVGELTYSPFFPPALLANFADVKWYLWCLLMWRFTVSPLFAAARHLHLPTLVPFVLTLALAFVLPNCIPNGVFHHQPPFLDMAFGLAPFFAVGLLRPAKWWFTALESQTLTKIAVLFLVIWYGCICLSPRSAFSEWASRDARLVQFKSTGLTLGNVFYLADLALSKFGISLAMMWVLAAVHDQFQKVLPRRFMEMLVGCGSRTLNGYVLHMYVTVFVIVTPVMKFVMPFSNPSTYTLLTLLISAHACFTWCCKLTDRLVGWLLMPYWIKRWAKYLFDLACAASGRSMLDDKDAASKETSSPTLRAPAGEMLNAKSGEQL